jgi:hypothetical protein
VAITCREIGAKLGNGWIIVETVGYAKKGVANWRDGWLSRDTYLDYESMTLHPFAFSVPYIY